MKKLLFIFTLTALLHVNSSAEKNQEFPLIEERVRFMPQWWWKERHQAIKSRADKKDISVLFVGDSITNMMFGKYPKGKSKAFPVWERTFGEKSEYNAANFGVSGCKIGNVLWQIDHNYGENKPRVISLLIGTNNLHANKNTPEQVASGIIQVVDRLRKWSPNSFILVHTILPRDDFDVSKVKKETIDKANSLLKPLKQYKQVEIVDLTSVFRNEKGEFQPQFYDKDRLHLNKEGYKKWFALLEPMVERYCQEGDAR